MTFDIKLKTGFFKTQSYFLTIEQGQIILTPRDNDEGRRVVIGKRNLQSIYLYKGEFEIVTDTTVITGIFPVPTNLQEISQLFNREFEEKFMG